MSTYDVNGLCEQIKNIFLTSTASLCASLTTNVTTITTDSILIGNPTRITRQIDQYPCLIINPRNKAADWDMIGMEGNKTSKTLVNMVDIYCMTQCASDSEDADKQARILSRNVENILESNQERNNSTSTVNDAWHSVLVKTATFDGAYNEKNQTYQSVVKLECEFKSWSIR